MTIQSSRERAEARLAEIRGKINKQPKQAPAGPRHETLALERIEAILALLIARDQEITYKFPDPNITVNVPEQKPVDPKITVNVPESAVTVNVPDPVKPSVHVNVPEIKVPAPIVNVKVPEMKMPDFSNINFNSWSEIRLDIIRDDRGLMDEIVLKKVS